MAQLTFFSAQRMSLDESIELTIRSVEAYGPKYDHWCVAYSGGKDSTTLVSLMLHLFKTDRIARPRRFTVLYADTRMELPPLAHAAGQMLGRLASEGVDARTVVAPVDKRFLVYILGRGVTPPNNATQRWCTRQIKVDPMKEELGRVFGEAGGKILMLTGVRQGESAVRDQRIVMSCGKNGAECGQGWYQETMPDTLCDTLAPLLHWRTCLVWDWLSETLGPEYRHGYPTQLVAEAYGLGAEGSLVEMGARTGCICCPLAQKDTALDNLLKSPRWSYLAPLLELKPLYAWFRRRSQRHRKVEFEYRQDGTTPSKTQCRQGPLTRKARLKGLETVLDVQRRCNEGARASSSPPVDILNAAEESRIRELIAANAMPRKWSGDEPVADEPYAEWTASGELQSLLPEMFR